MYRHIYSAKHKYGTDSDDRNREHIGKVECRLRLAVDIRYGGIPGGGEPNVPGGDGVGDRTYNDCDDVQCDKDTTNCDDDPDCTLHGSLVHLRGGLFSEEGAEPSHNTVLCAKGEPALCCMS